MQVAPLCSPQGITCCESIEVTSLGCRKGCSGLYADIHYTTDSSSPGSRKEKEELIVISELEQEYKKHKRAFLRNLEFDPDKEYFSKGSLIESFLI